jgi:hypothetical protein
MRFPFSQFIYIYRLKATKDENKEKEGVYMSKKVFGMRVRLTGHKDRKGDRGA